MNRLHRRSHLPPVQRKKRKNILYNIIHVIYLFIFLHLLKMVVKFTIDEIFLDKSIMNVLLSTIMKSMKHFPLPLLMNGMEK